MDMLLLVSTTTSFFVDVYSIMFVVVGMALLPGQQGALLPIPMSSPPGQAQKGYTSESQSMITLSHMCLYYSYGYANAPTNGSNATNDSFE